MDCYPWVSADTFIGRGIRFKYFGIIPRVFAENPLIVLNAKLSQLGLLFSIR